jgi:hypothetical protein
MAVMLGGHLYQVANPARRISRIRAAKGDENARIASAQAHPRIVRHTGTPDFYGSMHGCESARRKCHAQQTVEMALFVLWQDSALISPRYRRAERPLS